jgi:hypothetical protein
MALHGKLSNNLLDGTAIVNLETVTIDRVSDIVDTPAMGDDWTTRLVGLTDFTITAEGKSQVGLVTVAAAGLLGDAGTNIAVIEETNASYSAAAILTEFTETATVDDAISISYTIVGNDEAGLIFDGSGTGGAGSSLEIHGKNIDAEYAVGSSFAEIRGWSVTASVATSDTSTARPVASPLECGRTKIVGLKSASATVTILTPVTDLDLIVGPGDTLAVLNLWRQDGTAATGYYTGAAKCTGTNTGMNVNGELVTVISFVFDGAVELKVA